MQKGTEWMNIILDRAVYPPGGMVSCDAQGLPEKSVQLLVTLWHLEERILRRVFQRCEAVKLQLPQRDFIGYLVEIEALDATGKRVDRGFAGIDCASEWIRFPRYGYVWNYTEQAEPSQLLQQMKRFHINGVQFYDWQYRHHIPLAPDLDCWEDWSGRTISGKQIRAYLDAAHQAGMVCLAYNMIYAANLSYRGDESGIDPSWRLVKENGEDFTCDMDASRGETGILQYFNPLDSGWQRYIFRKEQEVMEAFSFDGWHGDTIGEMGPMRTAVGRPLGISETGEEIYLVKDTYTTFLNAAKKAMGNHYLVFNPVGAQGFDKVNASHVDVLYTEFWPWDKDDRGKLYEDYYSIHRAILRAWEQSGKSLIVAAYINYRNPDSYFNPAAVKLMDSVVSASGGGRIEIGNGDNMLSDEYFPADQRKRMREDLQSEIIRMYDFVVAYENLLRDGQKPISARVDIPDRQVSLDGAANTIWCFAKEDEHHVIYHLINLVGTDANWRDTEQTKRPPEIQQDLQVIVHTEQPVEAVYLASPDQEDLSLHPLEFKCEMDGKDFVISFQVSELYYWDMVILRKSARE